MAAASAIKEALWLRKLLSDLQLGSGTISIFADNQSAIKLLRNPIITGRAKHIDVMHHFARERRDDGGVVFILITWGSWQTTSRNLTLCASGLAYTPHCGVDAGKAHHSPHLTFILSTANTCTCTRQAVRVNVHHLNRGGEQSCVPT
jgi:hypothetical protein